MSSTKPIEFTKDEIALFWSDACKYNNIQYAKKGTDEYNTVMATFKDTLAREKFYRLPEGLKKWNIACHRLGLDPRYVKKDQPDHKRVVDVFKTLKTHDIKVCPY